MSEKSCSVRLVTGTVILRNSKPHVLFLISPITSLHEHIATYEVGGGGGGGGHEREKKVQLSFPGCLFLENTRENLKLNVVLILESKAL